MIESGNRVRVRVAGFLVRDGRLLFISHKKDGRSYWLLPGGGVDHGESLEEALRREFYEELGVSVIVEQPILMCDSIDPSGDRHIVNIIFACSYSDGQFRLGEEERLNGFDFFALDRIPGLTIFPPINKDLVDLMNREQKNIYIGKIWLED